MSADSGERSLAVRSLTLIVSRTPSAAPAIIAEAAKRGIGETPVEVNVELGGAVSGGGY